MAATDTAVLRETLAAGRRLYPGQRLMAVRRRPNGSGHLVDRALRRGPAR